MMRRLSSSLLALCFSLLSLPGAAGAAEDGLERIRNSRAVNIGFRPAATPFSYLLPGQATPVGYAIDICRQVVEDLKKELKLPDLAVRYVPVDHKARFPALQDGTIDMECANSSITAERLNRGFAFSLPYFITGTKLLARTDLRARNLRDLVGRRVIVADQTIAAGIVKSKDAEHKLDLKFVYMKSRAEGLQMLEQDQGDALVEDVTNLWGQRALAKDPKRYEVIGDYLGIEPMAVMMRKESPGLKAVADQTLRRLMRGGDIARLHHQWFELPVPPKNLSMEMPMGPLMKDMIRFPTDQVVAFP